MLKCLILSTPCGHICLLTSLMPLAEGMQKGASFFQGGEEIKEGFLSIMGYQNNFDLKQMENKLDKVL